MIQRINVMIPANANLHRPFLYNEMYDFMKQNKLRCKFSNDSIEFSSIPERLVKGLEELKIKFEIIKNKKQ